MKHSSLCPITLIFNRNQKQCKEVDCFQNSKELTTSYLYQFILILFFGFVNKKIGIRVKVVTFLR
jgi:hypothetical protein